jgi:hypothetical protein
MDLEYRVVLGMEIAWGMVKKWWYDGNGNEGDDGRKEKMSYGDDSCWSKKIERWWYCWVHS